MNEPIRRETHYLCFQLPIRHLALAAHGACFSCRPHGVHHRRAVAFAGRRSDSILWRGLVPMARHFIARFIIAIGLLGASSRAFFGNKYPDRSSSFRSSEEKLVAGSAVGPLLVPVSRQDPTRIISSTTAGSFRMMTCINLLIIMIPSFGTVMSNRRPTGHPPPFHLVVDHLLIDSGGGDSHSYHRFGYAFPHVLHHSPV